MMAGFMQMITICCLILLIGYRTEANCGIKGQSSRLSGGSIAKQNEWPWMVQIIYKKYGQNAHLCGGALISPRWLITSTNCLRFGSVFDFSFVFGEHDRFSEDGYEQTNMPLRIIKHPDFDWPTKMNNDIALVELLVPVRLNRAIGSICLPTENEPVTAGTKCMTAGWGIQSTSELSRYLKHVEMKIVGNNICQQSHPNIPITRTMLCGVSDQGSGCRGDGGGPLMCKKADGSWVLQGLLSFGSRQCSPGAPNVFTKISQFRKWIGSNTGL